LQSRMLDLADDVDLDSAQPAHRYVGLYPFDLRHLAVNQFLGLAKAESGDRERTGLRDLYRTVALNHQAEGSIDPPPEQNVERITRSDHVIGSDRNVIEARLLVDVGRVEQIVAELIERVQLRSHQFPVRRVRRVILLLDIRGLWLAGQ